MITLDDVVLSLFPQLTTHLKHVQDDPMSQLFPYDGIIAVIAVTYCRFTVNYSGESKASRLCWSALLGYLSYNQYDYWLQIYTHILSFGIFFHEKACEYFTEGSQKKADGLYKQVQALTVIVTVFHAIGHILFSISYPASANSLFQSKLYEFCSGTSLFKLIWEKFVFSCGYLLPVNEFISAHDIITEFVVPAELYAKAGHLLFITFHIQVGMGYLGISFLRAEQSRKNALIKIEDDKKKADQAADAIGSDHDRNENGGNKRDYDPSAKFRNSAGSFILFAALPYMVQIVFYGGINMYAFHCFRDDIHRTIRLNDLFANDGARFVATATSKTSNLSPDSYASNSETVISTVYDLINRNLFSLPKLMLLPGIALKQPMLLLKITPLILISDWIKSTIVATMTNEVERINKEVKDVSSKRS